MYDNFIATMYGPAFLLLYGLVAGAACFLLIWRRDSMLERDDGRAITIPADPDPYEIAYLRNGSFEVLKLVTYNLLRRGYFISSSNSDHSEVHIRPSEAHPSASHLDKLEALVFNSAMARKKLDDFLNDDAIRKAVKSYCEETYAAKMEKEGWAYSNKVLEKWARFKGIVIILVLLLGGYKLQAAEHSGKKNTTILFFAMAAFGIVAGFKIKAKRLTGTGQRYLDSLTYTFRSKFYERKETLPHHHLLLLAGIYGMEYLEATPHGYIEKYMREHGSASGGGEGGCSSGSSCSSGGSCSGGGSCGGGCGGCGGCS